MITTIYLCLLLMILAGVFVILQGHDKGKLKIKKYGYIIMTVASFLMILTVIVAAFLGIE